MGFRSCELKSRKGRWKDIPGRRLAWAQSTVPMHGVFWETETRMVLWVKCHAFKCNTSDVSYFVYSFNEHLGR